MAQAIIFDMDGTLFQTDTILEPALADTFVHLQSLGKWENAVPLEQYRKIMGVPLKEVWQTLLPDHSEEDRAYMDRYFLTCLIKAILAGNGALYPHVEEILQFLKTQGCSVYIASNGLVEYLEAIVRYYELDQWISGVFSIEQIDSLNKSDLVRLIVDTHQITDGVVVGDRLSDIRAAHDNGLTAVGCQFGFAAAGELAEANLLIDDLSELKEQLLRRTRLLT